MRIGRLFLGASRTNEMSCHRYTVASWSYETGYWRWAIWWTKPATLRELFRVPRIGPGMAGGTRWSVGAMASGWAVLPVLGSLSFTTQPLMESMKHFRRQERA